MIRRLATVCALIALTACRDGDVGLASRVAVLGGPTLPTATRLIDGGSAPVCRRPDIDPAAGCATVPPPAGSAHRDLFEEVQRIHSGADSVDALHAQALIDLIWADDERTVDRAIDRLESLTGAADSASIVANLAVAWERKARLSGRAAHWARALDYAGRAAAVRVTPITLLNRAVLLERFRMNALALEDWERLAAHPDAGPWRTEADTRIRVLRDATDADAVLATLDAVLVADDAASLSAATEAAAAFPQIARRFATVNALPAWVRASRSGDTASARRIIAVIAAIGSGIEQRSGDAGIGAEAAALRAGTITDDLADAYLAYAAAELDFEAGRFADMAENAARAASLAGSAKSVIVPWAKYTTGIGHVMSGDLRAGDSIFSAILADPESADRHSLRGRALWGRGLIAARQYRAGSALDFYEHSSDALRRSFEAEYVAGMSALMVEPYVRSGHWLEAWDRLGDAMEALTAHRASVYLANAYRRASDMAARDGMPHAALAFQREGLAVATATPRAQQPIEASINLGLRLAALGHGVEADSIWNDAAARLPVVPDADMRQRLAADLRNARLSASLLPGLLAGENASVDSITRSLELFRGMGLGMLTASTLYQRAEAFLEEGDTAAARSDLEDAVSLIVGALRDMESPQRLPLESARRAIELLTRILAATGGVGRALAISDIARAVQLGAYELASVDEVTLPAGRTVVAMMALPDELLVWHSDGGGIRLVRREVARETLADSIDAFTAHLRDGLPPDRSTAGAWLSRTLFPDAETLPSELSIVADETIARLAAAALPLPDGTLLVDRTVIRIVPAIRQFAEATGAAPRDGNVVLVAGSADAEADLPALPHARAEVEAIADLRAGTRVHDAADSGLVDALRHAGIFHFAGHAILGESPLDSRLVISDTGPPGLRYLQPADLGADLFPLLATVVLSSCRTLDPGAAPGTGLSAFAAAFMRAGAGTVVGTLWPIDDAAAVDLMVSFHRSVRDGASAAEALAYAQREARSRVTGTHANVWAAFQVLTR